MPLLFAVVMLGPRACRPSIHLQMLQEVLEVASELRFDALYGPAVAQRRLALTGHRATGSSRRLRGPRQLARAAQSPGLSSDMTRCTA